MRPTRRSFLDGAAALAGVACGGLISFPIGVARADRPRPDVALDELMKPGPLPDHFLGVPEAPIMLVEYVSMTCTHCAQFAISTLPELRAKYIETGKVRYTVREFPLDQYAAVAAMIARSSGERYFTVIDTLLREQRRWSDSYLQPLLSLAVERFGFTPESFQACIADRKLLADIKATFERAKTFGVNSAPLFFVNGVRRSGFLTITQMDDAFEPFLKT